MYRLVRLMVAFLMLAVVALVAFAGCGSSGLAKKPDNPPAPAVTQNQAAQVLTTFAEHASQVTSSRRVDLLNDAFTGPLLPIETGRLTAEAYQEKRHGKHRKKPLTFSDARYLIPRSAGYPQWFAVQAKPDGSAHDALLVFERETAQAPFKASYATGLIGGSRLPAMHAAVRGGIPTVPLDASGLEVTPMNLPGLHAAVNLQGGSAFGAGALAGGPWTTGMRASANREAAKAKRAGFRYLRNFHPTGYRSFTLATAEGGALIWYSVGDEISSVRQNQGNDPRLWVSDNIAGAIGTNRVRQEYQVAAVHEYLAVIPPHGKGQVRVIGTVGGPVGGVGR